MTHAHLTDLEPPGGGSSWRREERQRRKTRQRRSSMAVFGAFLLVLALLAGIIFGGLQLAHSALRLNPDYPGPGTGQVVVQVKPGQSTRGIASDLRKLNVVRSTGAFLL